MKKIRKYFRVMENYVTFEGKSFFNSVTPRHQYAAVFSEINSIFRKLPCSGPKC